MNVVASNSATGPGSLPSSVLAGRLAELCGEERNVQVDFLLHLAEFDARRAWAEAGYGSLWVYCLEVLHLREGAAWRRIEGCTHHARVAYQPVADRKRDRRFARA